MKRSQTVQDFTQPLPFVGTFYLACLAGPDSLLLFRIHWESTAINTVILSIVHVSAELDPGRHHSLLSCGYESEQSVFGTQGIRALCSSNILVLFKLGQEKPLVEYSYEDTCPP